MYFRIKLKLNFVQINLCALLIFIIFDQSPNEIEQQQQKKEWKQIITRKLEAEKKIWEKNSKRNIIKEIFCAF